MRGAGEDLQETPGCNIQLRQKNIIFAVYYAINKINVHSVDVQSSVEIGKWQVICIPIYVR